MIPDGKSAIGDIALKVMFGIAPETSTTYAASNAGMIAMLLQCLAQEYDRGADSRMQDIEEMKSLFEHVPPDVAAHLSTELEAFRRAQPKSLRVSDVTELHAQGLVLLTSLHQRVEDVSARALETEIWRFLERMADRHAFDD